MKNKIKKLELTAIRVRQPIGDFYIAKMAVNKVKSISYSDSRKMLTNVDDY